MLRKSLRKTFGDVINVARQKKGTNDTAQMAAGMLLFWPALFFLEGGDGPEAAEYSQLKGEYEALREVSVEKNCSIDTSKSLDESVEDNLDEDDS